MHTSYFLYKLFFKSLKIFGNLSLYLLKKNNSNDVRCCTTSGSDSQSRILRKLSKNDFHRLMSHHLEMKKKHLFRFLRIHNASNKSSLIISHFNSHCIYLLGFAIVSYLPLFFVNFIYPPYNIVCAMFAIPK